MKKRFIVTLFLVLGMMNVLSAQTKIITGTVTSSQQGEGPIPGVAVTVKGTTLGTLTDVNGKYSLGVPANATTLVFSFLGMKTQEIAIEKNSVIDCVLSPDVVGLNEVVVTALGISREKKALGYATQDVKEDVIERAANPDLAGALQGKLAGVDIKPSSGMPGASSQIVIRGARSFTGNNTPLYIVDGLPIASTPDFSTGDGVTGSDISNRAIDIDPSDIASINILKGQAAAALYGIRASNGVVVITTKSGRNNVIGKPVVSFSHTSSFSDVSRNPDYQTTWAQGSNGAYVPTSSMSWGPKIADLPDDPTYGGNANGHPGQYLVPQLQKAGYTDPYMTPGVYNAWTGFFRTGYSMTNNLNVSQATESGNFLLGISQTNEKGIAPSTGMDRWNGKASAERNLNKNFLAGLNANFLRTSIDKLPSANDAALAGVYAAPPSYDLKDWPYVVPGDPYTQIYYRNVTGFDNPNWASIYNMFNEKTDRFFGNGYINYKGALSNTMKLNIKYQLGIDSYTTHLQDIFEFGHRGGTGIIDNYGVTDVTLNSLLTINYDWNISSDFNFNALVGNEFNNENNKTYSEHGEDFNFGGWPHIQNANTVTANESKDKFRTIGTFASLSLSYRSLLFLNATGRDDRVSQMPRGNRTFFYPSVSLSIVPTELNGLKNSSWLSFTKLRFSYAEVGQAGRYLLNYFTKPAYGGGFWSGVPVSYPIGGVNSYIPNNVQYDPNLKPQNTRSWEAGAELKFFKNRLGLDYTFSRQNVKNQIFSVPLAGSTGASLLVMNGGKVHTVSHEIILTASPVSGRLFHWDISANFSRVINIVDVLAPGVESIFLGGFTTPQVRAGIGQTYPVIYGITYARDANGNILVNDIPGTPDYGMPKSGEPGVIGVVSPKFILGGTNSFSFKGWSLSATVEWKNGGQMYSGSNGLSYLYGINKFTTDRTSTFIYPGFKSDGTPNDIVRGGPNDPNAMQELYANVLGNIDEFYIYDNSFVKLRELALRFHPLKKIANHVDWGVTAFARNFLLWTKLPNFDPESTQGNTNMGGSFERFSMPQTHSVGFSVDLTF